MNFIMEIEETNKEPKICAMRGRGDNNNQQIEFGSSEYSNALTTVSKDCMVAEPSIIANTAGLGQCYESKEVSPTVKSSAFQYNNALIEPKQEDPVVLGWVRDEKGNVIKRPAVDVANTVTAGKRDNTQNYVKEQIPLNTDQDGLATTVTTAHHYSGNIVYPKRGQKEMGVLETQHNLPFRVRRLTERELFRLMDVSEEDIDKIQAAGISKTQQAKMAGNSICVNVLYHIFRKMFVEAERETAQLELF